MPNFSKLTPLLESFIQKGPSGCALNVSINGETQYEYYTGYANVKKKKLIDADTLYRIYSLSKVATSVAMLQLFEKGLYLMNDPLEEYLPEYKDMNVVKYDSDGKSYIAPAENKILVKDMLCMTSGILYPDEPSPASESTKTIMKALEKEGAYDVRRVSKAMGSCLLDFEPGTHWKYGFSYDILGAFVEELSGKNFGQYLKENIFDPLGMNNTGFRYTNETKKNLAKFYLSDTPERFTKIHPKDNRFEPNAAFESGGGGLLSTLGDYSNLAQMLACGGTLHGERIIGKKSIELMATNHLGPEQMKDFNWPNMAGYGYGLGVRTMVDKAAGGCNGSIGEFGWLGYSGTWLLADPKEKLSAVYMHQLHPSMEAYTQPRMRAAIYGSL